MKKKLNKYKVFLILVWIIGSAIILEPWAQATDPGHSESDASSTTPPSEGNSKENPRIRKGANLGEKEAEGTQAPHRFDTVIPKSKYEVNGQSLEVDPD